MNTNTTTPIAIYITIPTAMTILNTPICMNTPMNTATVIGTATPEKHRRTTIQKGDTMITITRITIKIPTTIPDNKGYAKQPNR